MSVSESAVDFSKFSRVNKNGDRILSVAADIVLYVDAPFIEIPDAIHHAFKQFLTFCPKEEIRWYRTGSMTRHEAATPRALGMLTTLLRPSGKPRDPELEYKDGERPEATPNHLFSLSWYARESRYFNRRINWLRLMVPAEVVEAAPEALLTAVIELADAVPFVSGHAGYCLERSLYFESASADLAYPLLMRHPGLDFSVAQIVGRDVLRTYVKGVNWLTLLSGPLLEQVGGEKTFSNAGKEGLSTVTTKHGVIVRAGVVPQVGDVNRRNCLPAYAAVHRRIKPLLAPTYSAFPLSGDDALEKTQRWYHRFDDVPAL